jgi:hypothetical protein
MIITLGYKLIAHCYIFLLISMCPANGAVAMIFFMFASF